jgi:hypothetical protein
MGPLLILGSGLRITELALIFWQFFSTVPVMYLLIVTKKTVGRLFHKRIWSPWLEVNPCPSTESITYDRFSQQM